MSAGRDSDRVARIRSEAPRTAAAGGRSPEPGGRSPEPGGRSPEPGGRSLEQLLDDVAAPTPAPAGGSSAAWTCALAASLVEMTAAFATGRPDLSDHHERMTAIGDRARALRGTALELGERELHAYEPVLAALRLPRDHPERAERLDAALSGAAQAPFELARVGAELAELALDAADAGAPHLRGDAITAALLAEGACQAAAQLVRINLAGRPEDERLPELAEVTRRAAAIRASSAAPNRTPLASP